MSYVVEAKIYEDDDTPIWVKVRKSKKNEENCVIDTTNIIGNRKRDFSTYVNVFDTEKEAREFADKYWGGKQ